MQESSFLEVIFHRNYYEVKMYREIEQDFQKGFERGFQKGFERGFQKGFEQGSRETAIKCTLVVLTKRFPQQDMQQVAEALEAITSLDRLIQLIDIAVDTPSVETFLTVLNA